MLEVADGRGLAGQDGPGREPKDVEQNLGGQMGDRVVGGRDGAQTHAEPDKVEDGNDKGEPRQTWNNVVVVLVSWTGCTDARSKRVAVANLLTKTGDLRNVSYGCVWVRGRRVSLGMVGRLTPEPILEAEKAVRMSSRNARTSWTMRMMSVHLGSDSMSERPWPSTKAVMVVGGGKGEGCG